jgi:transcriptional regulator with XRE-family HTH domain
MNEPPVDPALWEWPAMRRALARRDITAVYTILTVNGISQRRISALTGQYQSEISEILKGRPVKAYDLMARIAEGLGIPRGYLGLALAEDPTYRQGDAASTGDEDDEAVKRRVLLAHVAAVLFDRPVLGEVLAIAAPAAAQPAPGP